MPNVDQELERHNPEANKPSEPYCGVGALFNADLHAVEPAYAPREDWQVISPYVIQLIIDE